MPFAIIAAIAGDALGTFVAGSLLANTTLALTTALNIGRIVAAAASFAITSVARSAFGGNTQQQPMARQSEVRTQILRSPVAVRQIIYGEAMIAGAMVFAASKRANRELHMVIAVAGHECESIGTFYLNDTAVGALCPVNTGVGTGTPTLSVAGTESATSISTTGWTPSTTNILVAGDYIRILPSFGLWRVTANVNSDGSGNATIPLDKAVGYAPAAGVSISTDVEGYVSSGTYRGFARFLPHLGAADQTADTKLVAADVGWTTAHRMRGIAYYYVQLNFNQTRFPTGIPGMRCVVRGKKLYDPRTATTAYSNNSALVVHDYLRNYYGAETTEIDSASFIAAANACDETVTLADGSTESRYTANGVILTDTNHNTAMQQILTSCGGALTNPEGTYRLNPAVYSVPVKSFDEDSLRGAVRVRAAVSKKELFNAVKGQYIDPDKFWQSADFPPIVNANYATDDGGQIFTDIQLPFTTSPTMAQRLAKITLEKARQGITVELQCKFGAIHVLPQENINLNISHLGWDFASTIDEMLTPIDEWGYLDSIGGKVFKVMRVTLAENGGVDLVLREEASACYDWSAEETAIDLAPNTTLPDPFSIAQPGNVQMVEELYETTGSAGVKTRAIVTWDAPDDGFIVDYELEYKLHSSSTWLEIFNIRGTRYEFADMTPGVYDFRVKSRNILNVTSEYTPDKTFTVYGLTAPPADVSGFSVAPMTGVCLASWTLTTDLDVRIGGRVILRYSPLTSGATFSDGVTVAELNGDAISAVVPMATGTYMAKFRDSSGNYSNTEATFVATEATLTGWTTVTTSTQHATFTGTKTDCVVSGSNLIMDGTALTATYAFSATIDMTTAVSRRFHGHIKATAYNASGLFDSSELFDSGEFFDETGAINDCDAWLEIRTTPDDPAGTPTWSAWQRFMVADFYARAVQARLQMTRASASNNIEIQELSLTVKVPA